MSHPTRPQARGPAKRPRRRHEIEALERLETLQLLAPVVSSVVRTAVLTPSTATTPTNDFLGTITISAVAKTASAAAITSVTQFASNSQFGGDIVRIKAGPGGDFGKDVYAISRGAGENADPSNRPAGTAAPINRPGVIYRLDPATGKSTVFFDLNNLISQIEPGATSSNSISSTPAANSVSTASGLLNWYDITFDPEGYFDGKPSMFVSTVDASDPNKNAIYQIGPDGSLLGVFVKYTAGGSTQQFEQNPTAILIPPVEQQNFLRGLIASGGAPGINESTDTTGMGFEALFFNANAYSPGQNIVGNTLPTGATKTPFVYGPQVGITAANPNYTSPEYSAFTDFGTPATVIDGQTVIAADSGLSGVDGMVDNAGLGTELISYLNNGLRLFQNYNVDRGLLPAEVTLLATQASGTTPSGIDGASGISTEFRRFQDIAFDQYGYFSSNATATVATTSGTGTGTGTAATGSDVLPYAGSVFTTDLATGLAISLTPITPPGGTAIPAILAPIQGPGPIGVQLTDGGTGAIPLIRGGNNTTGATNQNERNLGGRIIRIDPQGNVDEFATGFHTSSSQSADSFYNSSLSITFSADGTTLYASDDDGIWQFKTTASLAGSTSGSIVGLNDLRTLGVPYDGQGSAVAVLDSGVDAANPSFRGRVSPGTNVLTNGLGNDDTAPGGATSASSGSTGGTTGGTGTATTAAGGFPDGHGTLVAGVVAQFVPQATIEPVAIFSSIQSTTSSTGGGTGGTGGSTSTTSTLTTVNTTPQLFYEGLQYVADHPFVADPVRPNTQNRVIATTLAFGTTRTFQNEVDAYKLFPQFSLSVKTQLAKLRKLGITPIGAAGQLGVEGGTGGSSGGSTGGSTGGTTGGTTTTTSGTLGDPKGMSLPAVFNEVLSVTGTYSFPVNQTANSSPLNDYAGIVGRQAAPTLLGALSPGSGGSTGGTTGGTGSSTTGSGSSLSALTAGDATIFNDKLLSSANRSITTDYAAPALDVPTFRRTVVSNATTTGITGSGATAVAAPKNNPADMVYQQGGTSLSAGIVAGSFALVASAVDYWSQLYPTGATVDAYLTTPVGVTALNFGPKSITDLSAYSTPDGINSILQWTAVPAVDDPYTYADATSPTSSSSGGSTGGTTGGTGSTTTSTPTVQTLFGTATPRSYSRVSVSNAIAAIEGTEALNYLIKNNTLSIIDGNKDGLITAAEIQTFVDNSAAMGMPEAGAMARMLGGTARIPGQGNPLDGTLESPDQPDVLQRRFNFFDYAANGRLAGVISISDLKMLSQKLLPQPDAFTVTDRQRSSQTNYLLDPTQPRATKDLQHKLPTAMFIPLSRVAKFRGVSPNAFGIGRFGGKSVNPFTTGPTFTLYGNNSPLTVTRTTRTSNAQAVAAQKAAAAAAAAKAQQDAAAAATAAAAKPADTSTTKTSLASIIHTQTPSNVTNDATVTTSKGSTNQSTHFAGVPTALGGASTVGSLTTPAATTPAPTTNPASTPTVTKTSKLSNLIAKPKTST